MIWLQLNFNNILEFLSKYKVIPAMWLPYIFL